MIAQDRVVRGVKVPAFIPIFPSYIFLFTTEQERVDCLTTNRTCQWLKPDDGKRLLADLSQLQRLIDSGAPLTVEARLSPGRRVRIKHGALAGLEGTVIHRRRKPYLIIDVRMLEQGVSVQIEDMMVEPID